MGFIRTVLALVVMIIPVHVGLAYAGMGKATNGVTEAVYSLGVLLESPAAALLRAVPALQQYLNPNSFYTVALTAAAAYFILYLLLGVGKRN